MTLAAGKQPPPPPPPSSPPSGPRRPPWLVEAFYLAVQQVLWRSRFITLCCKRALGLCEPRKFNAAQVAEGLTFVLPGIESESVFTYGICDGLLNGGLAGAVRIFNWGLPFPGGYLANLTRIDRNRRRAADLAREIIAYQDQHPGRPVHVVGHSGGVGVAVFAVEALPPGRQIESLILLNGALAPTYDLRPALRKTRRGILNSYSPKDWFVLGWGTRFFGTTDRQFTVACGCVGFQPPENLNGDAPLYRKLTQICWRPDMADGCCHWGGHITSASEEFLAQHVMPWLKEEVEAREETREKPLQPSP